MNRILFLPLNRPLLYFWKRALFKGHLPLFKFNPGNVRAGTRSEYFIPQPELRAYYDSGKASYSHLDYWKKYLKRWRINHVVTNIEVNSMINDCLMQAIALGIKTSYVMHGGGKIYDYKFQKDWYRDSFYNYFYAKDEFTKNYLGANTHFEAKKFTLDFPKVENAPEKIRKVLFVPSQTHPSFFLDGSGVLVDNEEKYKYQKCLLYLMDHRKDVEFIWCHSKDRNAVPNKIIPCLEKLDSGNNVIWVEDSPQKYFDQVDACLCDVGSSFFFEAIRAGKPVLCLHHYEAVKFKPGVNELFGRCVQKFSSLDDLMGKFTRFLQDDPNDFIPVKYIEREQLPNDPLIWEERK